MEKCSFEYLSQGVHSHMPMIAIFAIFAIVLTLTASESKKPETEPSTKPNPLGDDPTDLLAQALESYLKDKKKPGI